MIDNLLPTKNPNRTGKNLDAFALGEIEQLAPNLWHVTGTLPSSMMVPREMIL